MATPAATARLQWMFAAVKADADAKLAARRAASMIENVVHVTGARVPSAPAAAAVPSALDASTAPGATAPDAECLNVLASLAPYVVRGYAPLHDIMDDKTTKCMLEFELARAMRMESEAESANFNAILERISTETVTRLLLNRGRIFLAFDELTKPYDEMVGDTLRAVGFAACTDLGSGRLEVWLP